MLTNLSCAIALLRPDIAFADMDGTLEHVRWDTPGVTPPTQEEVDEAIARLANPVPEVVTAGRLIQALDELDLLDSVDTVVAQADPLTKRLWERAPEFPRNDPMIAAVAQALGKTDEDLDEIFRLAATK